MDDQTQNDQDRLSALTLTMIRSIVESYDGSIVVDSGSRTVSIDVPEDKIYACVEELEARVGAAIDMMTATWHEIH